MTSDGGDEMRRLSLMKLHGATNNIIDLRKGVK